MKFLSALLLSFTMGSVSLAATPFDLESFKQSQKNDEKIILSQDSDIFPGDSIVMSGAFGLNLALKAQKSGPVSGHSHTH